MFDTANMVTVRNWTQTCKNSGFSPEQQSVSLSFQDASQDFIFSFLCTCLCILYTHFTNSYNKASTHTSKHNYFQIYQNNVMLLWKLRRLCQVMVMLWREREKKTRTWESLKRSVQSRLQNKSSASCVWCLYWRSCICETWLQLYRWVFIAWSTVWL